MINIFIIHYFVPIKNVFMQFGADHIMLVVGGGSCYHGLMRGGCWLILTVTDVKSPPPLPWSPLVSTGLHWWPWYTDWRLSVSSLSQVKCWHCLSLITSTTIMYIYNIQSCACLYLQNQSLTSIFNFLFGLDFVTIQNRILGGWVGGTAE